MAVNAYVNHRHAIDATGFIVSTTRVLGDHVQLLYTNGGLVYTFPAPLVTEVNYSTIGNINVVATVELVSPFVATITYVVLIEAVTATSVTIRVNKIDGSGPSVIISEAATNEVVVSLDLIQN
jgi:hypothetical protein